LNEIDGVFTEFVGLIPTVLFCCSALSPMERFLPANAEFIQGSTFKLIARRFPIVSGTAGSPFEDPNTDFGLFFGAKTPKRQQRLLAECTPGNSGGAPEAASTPGSMRSSPLWSEV